ncbi:MAG: AsmA family protein [Mariprofundus sp.]
MSGAIAKTVRYGLIVVGLLIVTLLAAPLFIDVNVYKDQIEKTVEDATGRTLSIGNMNASLFPWVGVEVDDVHLANRTGFAKRDFISVERLHVKLALLPLLSKNVEIKHFEVVTPIVYLERNGNGESNWGDLVSSVPDTVDGGTGGSESGQSPSASPAAPALAALQAESLSLIGGEVTWVDAAAKPVILSELNVALRDVQLNRPVAVKVSGKLSGNAFELDANVGPLGDLAKLDPIALPVQGHFKADNIRLQPFKDLIAAWPEQLGDINNAAVGISAQMEQRPDGIRLGEGELHLNAAHALGLNWKIEMPKADQLKINRASLSLDGKNLIDAKSSVKQLTTNPAFNVRIDGHAIERTWLTTFVPDLKAMYAGHPSAWKQLKFSALLAGGSKQMDIRDLQLKLDNDLLQATGAVVYSGPDIRLRMNASQLHLDPWLPQAEQEKAALNGYDFSIIREAVAAAAATAEPDLRFLKSWSVSTKLQVGTMFMRGLEMGNFAATMNGSNGRFDLSPLSFNLAGGKVTEKASLNIAAYPAKWKESVHITGVQAGPLLKALANMDMLTGMMAMDTSFRATGLTPDAVKTLNGRGNVLFKNGKIKGFDIAGAIRKFTNPAASQAGPKETDFAQLSGSFNIRNGMVDNRDLFMSSPLLRVTGHGKVNLVSKTMDYHVKPRVVGSLKGQGDSVLRKGLSVPLHITGPFESPKIRPEINARTLIDNAPALLNKGGVGGALGNILGGKKGGADAGQDAAQPQSQPEATPEPPQKKLLKGLGGMIPGF